MPKSNFIKALFPFLKNYGIYFILLLALLLRTIQINDPYVELFGWRETSTAMMAANLYEGKTTLLNPMVNYGGPGPNYQGREFQTVTFIASKLYYLFGQKDWVGRAVSIFFGLIGILALYGLVREVWDKKRALLAAFLLATLPGSVFLERSFLPDPAMVAMFTMSLYLAVLYLKRKQLRYFYLAAAVGCLAVLTKLNGAIIAIPLLYLVFSARKSKLLETSEIIKVAIGFVLAGGIVIAYYLWARHLSVTYPPYHFAGSGKFISPDNLGRWFENFYFLGDLYYNLNIRLWSGPVVLLFVLGLVVPVTCIKPYHWLFHFWSLAIGLQYFIEAEHLTTDPNNLLLWSPLAAIFAGNALNTILEVFRERFGLREATLATAATFGLLVIISAIHLSHLFEDAFLNHNRLGTKLKEMADNSDLVICLDEKPIAIYYSGLNGWVFPPSATWKNKYSPDYGETDINIMNDLMEQGAKWIIVPRGNTYSYHSKGEQLMYRNPGLYDFLNHDYYLFYSDDSGSIYKVKQQIE